MAVDLACERPAWFRIERDRYGAHYWQRELPHAGNLQRHDFLRQHDKRKWEYEQKHRAQCFGVSRHDCHARRDFDRIGKLWRTLLTRGFILGDELRQFAVKLECGELRVMDLPLASERHADARRHGSRVRYL